MADDPGRVLPADPWGIQLAYRHHQPWWFDVNEPERWQMSAAVHDGSGTDIASHVGDLDVVLVYLRPTAATGYEEVTPVTPTDVVALVALVVLLSVVLMLVLVLVPRRR